MEKLSQDPIQQFEVWFQEATQSKEAHPDAITLATASKNGKPSARMVLHKGISDGGFLFFTNYESRKSNELDENPHAALVFYWPTLFRQVRVEGRVEKVTRKESEDYFKSRPRGSQIGAWASDQSRSIESRTALEDRARKLDQQYQGKEIPCPPFWGGFRLVPERIEFWINATDRLHDRFSYTREKQGWKSERLCP